MDVRIYCKIDVRKIVWMTHTNQTPRTQGPFLDCSLIPHTKVCKSFLASLGHPAPLRPEGYWIVMAPDSVVVPRWGAPPNKIIQLRYKVPESFGNTSWWFQPEKYESKWEKIPLNRGWNFKIMWNHPARIDIFSICSAPFLPTKLPDLDPRMFQQCWCRDADSRIHPQHLLHLSEKKISVGQRCLVRSMVVGCGVKHVFFEMLIK